MRNLNPLAALAALLILTVGTTPTHAEPCELGWAEGVFCPSGDLDAPVRASLTWNDGSGDSIYVAGTFSKAGCQVNVGAIARWDGTSWSSLTGPGADAGVDGEIRSMVVFDDGSGPALFVGGEFGSAGGIEALNIARWDGLRWTSLGENGGGVDGVVHALTVYDDGDGPALYAGGAFTTAGENSVSRIARWDGQTWSSIGGGVNSTVFALCAYDDGSGPALYAGGGFTTAGSAEARRIARWDGLGWSALHDPDTSGLNVSTLYAMTVFDDGTGPKLYAGGFVMLQTGGDWGTILRWDGSSLRLHVGEPESRITGQAVHSLATFDDGTGAKLYAGGDFFRAGGTLVRHVAAWDGTEWTALGDADTVGVDGCAGPGDFCRSKVYSLNVHDEGDGPVLFVGGDFVSAGGAQVDHIARWAGSWSRIDADARSGLEGCEGQLYCTEAVSAMAVFDDGTGPALFAGGGFTKAGDLAVNRIAKWDGTDWAALQGTDGVGVSGAVHGLVVFDDGTGQALYAGGSFSTAGGTVANNIAKWDGHEWSALVGPGGTGVNGNVRALAVYDDGTGSALYVGGSFETAGGIVVNRIARWDGMEWTPLAGSGGTGVSGQIGSFPVEVKALAVYDDGGGSALYVGGIFTTSGGMTANHIAKWDGSDWGVLEGPLDIGMQHSVVTLAVHDDGSGSSLFAGGMFHTAGGILANGIARWDGTAWSALIGQFGPGTPLTSALAVHDDGSGPALYVGGPFTSIGGLTLNHIAKWDDAGWSALTGPDGTGTDDRVRSLISFDDGTGTALYAGGLFTTAGGVASHRIAKWNSCQSVSSCNDADLDEPFGVLDLSDLVAFVTAFGAGDPAADLAEPFGVFDLSDLVAFVVAFEAGCP